jgi:methyltransferase (TIGR00027 family)
MQTGRPSTTAEIMAFFRALESVRRPMHHRLFHDPFATRFLRPWLRIMVLGSVVPLIGRLLLRSIDRRWPGARTSAIARTRLIDDWTNDGIAGGAAQVVILGAGFDSRAWRLPALGKATVFELDHPATSAEKRRRLVTMEAERSNIQFVAVDFERDTAAEALARSSFDPGRPAVVIWEGVTNYLTLTAVDATLRWVASLAIGTRLIFTYVHEGVLADPGAFEGATKILAAVTGTGEPWTFGLRPEALPDELAERGLKLREDLGAGTYRARYFGERAEHMRGYEFYRVALAEVVGITPQSP